MAKPQTEITKPLGEMSKTELFEIADELKIAGRYDMNKAQLLAAVEEALTAPDEPEPAKEVDGEQGQPSADTPDPSAPTNPLNDKPEEPKPEEPKEPIDLAAVAKVQGAERTELEARLLAEAQERERETREAEEKAERERQVRDAEIRMQAARQREEERRVAHANNRLHEDDTTAIMRADEEKLRVVLQDPQLPHFIAEAIRGELTARAARAEQAEMSRLQRSPEKQFKVTKGPALMRYVSKDGFVTTLPMGSLLTPLTHDLAHVASQGFEWQEIEGVELSRDQLGNLVSTAR